MPSTPKVKMPLLPSDFAALLNLPDNVEVISCFFTNDPVNVTLILMSDDEFDDMYAPDGGFDPTLSYKTIYRTHWEEPTP